MTCREAGRLGGQPTKLTPQRIKTICDAVAKGWSQEAAAGAAGISDTTLLNWIKWGREGREPYVGLFRELERARAVNEGALLDIVTRHAEDDWRAAQWLLSVKVPKRYANLVKHDLRFAAMSEDELDAYIATAEQALAETGESGAALPAAFSSNGSE